MTDTILASDGKALTVGIRVAVAGSAVGDPSSSGVVREISEADGDVNDSGRPIAINPSVTVEFDDGTDDSFTTSLRINGWGDYMRDDLPWVCDDLLRIEV